MVANTTVVDIERLEDLASRQGAYAVMEEVCDVYMDIDAVRALYQLAERAYARFELGLALTYAVASMNLGFAQAADAPKALQHELWSLTKTVAQSVAWWTWSGAPVEGIEYSRTDGRIGLEAAKLYLEMAARLGKEDAEMGQAYWIIAAQYMATGNYEYAQNGFMLAAMFLQKAEQVTEAKIASGLDGLSAVLMAPDEPDAQRYYDQVLEQLFDPKADAESIERIRKIEAIYRR